MKSLSECPHSLSPANTRFILGEKLMLAFDFSNLFSRDK
ncbi:hypothetical protein A33Q_1534 [Indibacter alkaliphilus LW1]|uniref:Uncharacterized protein n=1 Tax=Indibacter alkaliphilus (strain CCUG 57479 / KCTC 22604 / LW1) TaxID=1189612 RepID=S2DG02_INDAL|nr:hypothetical protein A33Q_1534 [Indibacter alkaliphilus LW1]